MGELRVINQRLSHIERKIREGEDDRTLLNKKILQLDAIFDATCSDRQNISKVIDHSKSNRKVEPVACSSKVIQPGHIRGSDMSLNAGTIESKSTEFLPKLQLK